LYKFWGIQITKTPLYDEHVKLGARIVEFAGWEMPVMYTNVIEEHVNTRTNASLFDISHMGELMIEGKEAERFLQKIITKDISRLKNRKCLYSSICNETGGVIDDIFVYKFQDNRFMLVINASTIEKDLKHLISNRKELDTTIANISEDTAKLDLQGPKSEEILKKSKKSKKGNKRTSKLKKTILGIAIALVLVFFLGYSVNTFYEEPEFDEICKDINSRIDIETCEDYEAEPTPDELRIVSPDKDCYCREIDAKGTMKCDATNPEYTECREEYEDMRETHGRISFIVLVILGLASILIGGLFLKVEAVSSGVMGGGVLTLLYAAMRFWGSIQDYGRLVVLGVALIVLIWVGYRKLKD